MPVESAAESVSDVVVPGPVEGSVDGPPVVCEVVELVGASPVDAVVGAVEPLLAASAA